MKPSTLACLTAEIAAARKAFPSARHQMTALTEEVGEVAQALIDNDRRETKSSHVFEEAIQVAAMAIRLAEEGDYDFSYRYSNAHALRFLEKKVMGQ